MFLVSRPPMLRTTGCLHGASAAQFSESKQRTPTPGTPPLQIEKRLSFFVVVRLLLRARGVSSYGGASPGPAYPPRQLDVLLHDGDPLGVDGAQVDVLEEVDEEGLGGLLKGLDRLRLPPELLADRPEVDCDFTNLNPSVSIRPISCAVGLESGKYGGKSLPAGQRGA